MEKIFLYLLCSLSFLLTSAAVGFGPNATGKELLTYCELAMDIHDRQFGKPQTEPEYILGTKTGICEGYLMSANEMRFKTVAKNSKNCINYYSFCLPPTYNLLVGASVVVKYLKNHPEQQNLSASLLVSRAFGTYFPC
ncbi:MAG TPA: Rap1a/Tai family immunity protein [Gammaproteobacteria bacterium]|nr:Rap1a/Tai family immunity protein [Gammaproteobacteria bacterium]